MRTMISQKNKRVKGADLLMKKLKKEEMKGKKVKLMAQQGTGLR